MCLFKMKMNCCSHQVLKKKSMWICYICQFLPSLDNLQTYLMKCANRNLLNIEKQLLEEIFKDHPYLDPKYTHHKHTIDFVFHNKEPNETNLFPTFTTHICHRHFHHAIKWLTKKNVTFHYWKPKKFAHYHRHTW